MQCYCFQPLVESTTVPCVFCGEARWGYTCSSCPINACKVCYFNVGSKAAIGRIKELGWAGMVVTSGRMKLKKLLGANIKVLLGKQGSTYRLVDAQCQFKRWRIEKTAIEAKLSYKNKVLKKLEEDHSSGKITHEDFVDRSDKVDIQQINLDLMEASQLYEQFRDDVLFFKDLVESMDAEKEKLASEIAQVDAILKLFDI